MRSRFAKIAAGVATIAALALGGAAIAGAGAFGGGGSSLSGKEAVTAKQAALRATGGGTANAVERDSEDGATYEVEVTKPDGAVVDVRLDGSFNVVKVDGDAETADDPDANDASEPNDADGKRSRGGTTAAPAPYGSHLTLTQTSDNARVRALVVEDEVKMAALLRRGLAEDGYATDVAKTGDDALWMARAAPYDVIVLDVMLPGRDGFAVCRELRESGIWAPILMLTARDAVEDRVEGLDSGADDYLTKPFSFAELLARLRALVRRGAEERAPVLQVGSLRLDPATRQVWRGDVEVSLSTKEFALLETFMRRPGHVLSRLDLLEHAWDYGYENRSNVIDVYVRYLREKVDRPFDVRSIETVRGAGYRLRVDGGS